MNYKKYLLDFFVVTSLMSAGLFYIIKQSWQNALIIGSTTALLTVVNKYYLDKKSLKRNRKQ